LSSKNSSRKKHKYDKAKLVIGVPPAQKKVLNPKKAANISFLHSAKNSSKQGKNRKKTQVRFRYGRIALIVGILLFAFWSIKPIFERIEQNQEQVRLEKKLAEIKKENNQLREEVDYVKSNDYVAQQARSLGLAKPNEEVIVVVPQNDKEKSKGSGGKVKKNDDNKESVTIWKQITDALSNLF
jgi:cell division protein FtsB